MSGTTTEPSVATRLRGDGVPLTLATGDVVQIVFDFDACCELEELCGSLDVFTARLAAGTRTKMLQAIAMGVAAGARHTGETWTVERARLLLDTKRLAEYREQLDEAMVRAFPPPTEKVEGKGSAQENGSPGPTTTTSPPSDTDEAQPSSGA